MFKSAIISLLLTLGLATQASANDYTLILKNGDNPACNIVASPNSASRVVIGYEIVELSEFTNDNGTYTYQWSADRPVTVAIQVDLANFYQPDIWMNKGCVYAPTFDAGHTTFIQQYLEPDPAIPYTCSCTSEWSE